MEGGGGSRGPSVVPGGSRPAASRADSLAPGDDSFLLSQPSVSLPQGGGAIRGLGEPGVNRRRRERG
jgi:hypothetical protein